MMSSPSSAEHLDTLKTQWMASWESALAAWSSYTKLSPPRFCFTDEDEKAEGLSVSFAMIRLRDHAVVIGLRQVVELGLEDFGEEILAHEIGHHVFVPGDLGDHARHLAHIRAGIPSREQHAALVANLYADLLINDRLQRTRGMDIAGVYVKLRQEQPGRLWTLYMRIYEILWELSPGTLVNGELSPEIVRDAPLGARLVRNYAKQWLDGAGRFGALCLPYLLEDWKTQESEGMPWLDAVLAGAGDALPDGLASRDPGELEGAIHPALDDDLSGVTSAPPQPLSLDEAPPPVIGREEVGGQKNLYRTPSEYNDLMRSLGVEIRPEDLTIQYYRERARPYLIKFPTREVRHATDPLPEGLEVWEPGAPISAVDWVESVSRSPVVIPGFTTVERTYGETAGSSPEHQPVDLYLGIDCSGSMTNPRHNISYPVLAGAVMTLSALRAGAQVRTTLSGEPGEFTSTGDYSRSEKKNLGVLTGYLGTGYAFGIKRLEADFLHSTPRKRPVHIMVITDADIFHMLNETREGWDIARDAPKIAGGGATFVLDWYDTQVYDADIARLRSLDWDVHFVRDQQELVTFARAFSKRTFER
ncbi:MAG: VWA domain-containing protein [Bradymonadaceae bacterium]